MVGFYPKVNYQAIEKFDHRDRLHYTMHHQFKKNTKNDEKMKKNGYSEKLISLKTTLNCNDIDMEKPRKCSKINKNFKNVNADVEMMTVDVAGNSYQIWLQHLPSDIFDYLRKFLSDQDLLNLASADSSIAQIINYSATILKGLNLKINEKNIKSIISNENLHSVQFKNLEIDFKHIDDMEGPFCVVNKFNNSIENIVLENAEFSAFNKLRSLLGGLKNIKSISMINCSLNQCINEVFPSFETLKELKFDGCNKNMFKAFSFQRDFERMTIKSDEWSWEGFPHKMVDDILSKCKNFKHLCLIGSGTGSFLDSDNFTFKLESLETTLMTFHWYVGIVDGRTQFLESQKGKLKELKIHNLPYDFDGGKVLKYIVEQMELDNFYYGEIPLIINRKKQKVKKFHCNEIQITSAYEMFRQFDIESFQFKISEEDISSEDVEKVVNTPTKIFDNLKEFEIFDESRYRGALGVYLGMFKKLKNIKKLILKTQNRNINTLLEEFLHYMVFLEEIYITSKTSRVDERFKIIKNFVPNLKKISVVPEFFEKAQTIFPNAIVCKIDDE